MKTPTFQYNIIFTTKREQRRTRMTEELWKTTIAQIKDTLPESDYSSWFTRLVFGGEENGKVTLYVPSIFFKDKFESSFRELIENTLSELGGQNYSILIEVKKDAQKTQQVKKSDEKSKTETSFTPQDQKNKIQKSSSEDMMFNPSYTFDSFVPGDNSNFAYSACLAIAKNPGSAYNPCLIYGGVGLGKTHLIQSIGNYIKTNTKQKVVYVTAENFTNEYIQSVGEKKTQQFKNKYRKVSVLLMDDIQFLQKKAETQNELFNTFNDLYDTGRQIVFTCDRPVEELRDITDRLRTRFERGLNIDLLPPNYETRVAILRKNARKKAWFSAMRFLIT